MRSNCYGLLGDFFVSYFHESSETKSGTHQTDPYAESASSNSVVKILSSLAVSFDATKSAMEPIAQHIQLLNTSLLEKRTD
jgi:hypothetical protein